MLLHGLKGCFGRADLDELRWMAQVQRNVFVENLLVDAPVFFQHKGIVGAANQQHLMDALLHQLIKSGFFKMVLRIVVYLFQRHVSHSPLLGASGGDRCSFCKNTILSLSRGHKASAFEEMFSPLQLALCSFEA